MLSLSLEDLSVSTEALYYDVFYRKFGVRRVNQFPMPKFSLLDTFELPRASIVHYLPESNVELGISPTHFFLRNAPATILAEHVTDLVTKEGSPIRGREPVEKLMVQYRQQYRRIRPLKNIETGLRDERTIIVENYALLNHLFRYRKTYQTRQFKFNNMMETVVAQMNLLAEKTDRSQFLTLTVPKHVPNKIQFVRGAAGLTRQTLSLFPTNDSLVLLELWKWLGKFPETSVFNKLSPKAITALNFVVFETGRFCVISADSLLSWIKSDENQGGIAGPQMQLMFIRFLDSVFTIRTAAAKTTIETSEGNPGEDEEESEIVAVVDEGVELAELQQIEEDQASGKLDKDDTQVQYLPADETDELVEPRSESGPESFSPGVIEASNYMLDQGLISTAEHRRFERLSTSIKTIKNPVGEGTLEDLISIDPSIVNTLEEVQLPDSPQVLDKSLLKSSLMDFDAKYIKKVMHADIANAVVAAQNAGIAVTDYTVEKIQDANSEYEVHSVKFVPVGGSPSTFRFRLPVVKEDGSFRISGTRYFLRSQRGDLPIRKINPFKVALTSYYSKLFITRSQKKRDNYEGWLLGQIELAASVNKTLSDVFYGNVFNHYIKVPRAFSIVATKYKGFTVGSLQLDFNIKEIIQQHGESVVQKHLDNNEVICGIDKKSSKLLLMSESGVIYQPDTKQVLGTLEEILALDTEKSPTEVIEIDIMGRTIPVGLVLAYYYGLSNLLRRLGAATRTVVRGGRMELDKDEYTVRFADQTLILSKQDRLAMLILSSFNSYGKTIATYDMGEFDRKDVYVAVFEKEALGARYVREMDNMNQLYIDPITKEILASLDEPTEFIPLLIRACELLLTDDHPDEMAGRFMRLKGYERFSGHVYAEMVRGIRQYKARPVTAKAKVDINPNAIWNAIQQDPSVSIVEDSNPIHNLKEKENVTFNGVGGRSSRTMVHRTRAFHIDDLGVISEATKDSSNVAVDTYLTPNPRLADLRGTLQKGEADLSVTSSLISTSALISPASTKDSNNRVNFISIQQSHVVAAKGYEPSPLRTGYEQVIAQRCDALFAFTAKAKGRINQITSEYVSIIYDDKTLPEDRVEIGRRYGMVTGKTVPHDIVCDLKEGSRVSPGDVVVFNSGFFVRDYLNPKQVTWMSGVMVKTALLESPDTLEDSSAISRKTAEALSMNTTKVRQLVLRFDQEIRNLVQTGEELGSDSILCNIQDPISSEYVFDESTSNTLNILSRNSPRAKCQGKVNFIEVLYNGELEDMSETIRELVSVADKLRKKKNRALGQPVLDGRAADLDMDTVVIKIYIDSDLDCGAGDKTVFGNQLKSVVRRVIDGVTETETGEEIGAIFSYISTNARIVQSPEIMGTTNVLLKLASQRAAKAYRAS